MLLRLKQVFTDSTKKLYKSSKLKVPFSNTASIGEIKKFGDSFMQTANAQYVEAMFEKWNLDKNSVGSSWDAYFKNVIRGVQSHEAYVHPMNLSQNLKPVLAPTNQLVQNIITDYFKLRLLIEAYRIRGHEFAQLDPLELDQSIKRVVQKGQPISHKEFGFTDADLDKEFIMKRDDIMVVGLTNNDRKWKLRDIIGYLENIYCDKIGYQYQHIGSRQERIWIRDHIENFQEFQPTQKQQIITSLRLCRDFVFTQFVRKVFTTTKRFGSEGLDSFISGLGAIVDLAAEKKVEHIVFGMAHRGRLNTLYSVFKKPAEQILAEFQEIGKEAVGEEEETSSSGDVQYHLGTTVDQQYKHHNHTIRLNIVANPSHLEACDPVVIGKVKAIQDSIQDTERNKAIAVLVHGDASLAGQGIVYETIQMHDLHDYTTGGVIHIVVNNQLGFTTSPIESRSTQHPTQIATAVESPIFHVNGNEPDLVDQIIRLALEYRMKFQKDVFVNIIGYRKYGHNELDQPFFTQPLMYKKIQQMRSTYEIYRDRLFQTGVLKPEIQQETRAMFHKSLQQAYEDSQQFKDGALQKLWQSSSWEELIVPHKYGKVETTGVPIKNLVEFGQIINTLPNSNEFNAHPQITNIYKTRLATIEQDTGLDFATAQTLAWASLLKQGFGVRLSGQDVERGTFSHRHSLLNDQTNGEREKFAPIWQCLSESEKRNFIVTNSHLSEFGVLGFEYGYTQSNKNCLVMWEGQFGDFANEAQVMIDNFIVSGEAQWGVDSAITLLLPHGMDGQGAEHSSGRIQRFLEASNDTDSFLQSYPGEIKQREDYYNLSVVYCSTTANYFHALRRQMRRLYRKPLMAFVSKKLLRYKPAASKLAQFDAGTVFQSMYDEAFPEDIYVPNDITKVVICSGQFYYDLIQRRKQANNKHIAILRIEELAPFPYQNLINIAQQYPNAKFIWAQEEHQNQGAWIFVRPRIRRTLEVLNSHNLIKETEIAYCGRQPSAASATGSHQIHELEQEQILKSIF